MNQDEFRASIKAERYSVMPIGSISFFTRADPTKMTALDFFTLSIGDGYLIVDDGSVVNVELAGILEIKIKLRGEQVTA